MSKQHRTKLIKSLEQQLEATTDPKIKADLSRQLTKLLSKSTRKGSSRKPEASGRVFGQPQPSTKLSIIDRVTESAVDQLPDGEKVLHYLVVEVEKMEKKQKFTSEEQKAAFDKLIAELSARDRAALEALSTEVA